MQHFRQIGADWEDWEGLPEQIAQRATLVGAWSVLERRIHLVAANENFGYAGGNNIGLLAARHKLRPAGVLILNSDVIISADLPRRLLERLQSSPKLGAVAPKIYYTERWGSDRLIYAAGTTLDLAHGVVRNRGIGEIDEGQYDEPDEMPCLNGSALLVRSAMLDQVGLIPEHYFMYMEDTAWTLRMKQKGWLLAYEPAAISWHDTALPGTRRHFTQAYYHTRNRLFFFKEYMPSVVPSLLLRSILRGIGGHLYRRRWHEARLGARAILDFFRGKSGPAKLT